MALTWIEETNIRGPQGPQGVQGPQGATGTGGAQGPAGGVDLTAGDARYVQTAHNRSLNAATFGFLPGNSAAANSAALATAVTAAAGKTLYIPGTTTDPATNAYHISSLFDLSAGQITVVGDLGRTWIVQDTDSVDLVKIGGGSGILENVNFLHAAAPSSSQGDGIVATDAETWQLRGLTVYQARTLFKATSGFFSNYMENLVLKRFYDTAVSIYGGTGSVWTNTYINNRDVTPQACTGWIVNLAELDDSVFNQLNIEWCKTPSGALLANGAHSVVINSLHLEQVQLPAADTAMVFAYGTTALLVNALTAKYNDVAPAGGAGGTRRLLQVGAGAQMIVPALYTSNNANTAAATLSVGSTDSDAASRLRIGDVRTDIFTAPSSGSGVRLIDGAAGPTGPAGADGAPGATGAQGPAGTAGDAIVVYDAGTAPGTWTPDAANGSRQRAVLGGAVTMNPPSNPPRDGFRVSVTLTATGASRVLTLGSAFLLLAGWPTSLQLSTTAVGFARMEYNAAKSKWVVLTLTATA